MKKNILFLAVLSFLIIPTVKAAECCVSQGGVLGTYTDEGYAICMDETPSYDVLCRKSETVNNKPSGTGQSVFIKGCTNRNAKNYNSKATTDDGSCLFFIYGCMSSDAFNYNASAEKDDGSCIAKVLGCTDSKAINYKVGSNTSDGSCRYVVEIDKEEIIYFKTIYQDDSTLLVGQEKIIQNGSNGTIHIKYRVTLDDKGREITKEKIHEKIILNSKDEIVRQGNQDSFKELTMGLYMGNFICMIFIILYTRYSKDHKYYLIHSIRGIPFQTKYFSKEIMTLTKAVLYIGYFIFTIPIYVDLCCIIKNRIVSLFL